MLLFFMLQACSGSKNVLSETNETALFLPPKIEAYVDMFVDEIDGKKVIFKILDSVQVDAGSHKILMRLEYQPAAGSAIVVGSLANLLLRSTTNKTFSTRFDIEAIKDHEYRFIIISSDHGFSLILKNETTGNEQLRHSFVMKDGKFERIY